MITAETFRAFHTFKKSLFVFLVLCSSLVCHAQKTYALHWQTDLSIAGLGLGTGTVGWAFGKKVKPFTSAELALLNRKDVYKIDRKATYLLSEAAFFYGCDGGVCGRSKCWLSNSVLTSGIQILGFGDSVPKSVSVK